MSIQRVLNGQVGQQRRRLHHQRVFVDVLQIRELEDPTFIEDFRMRKTVFERLVVVYGNHLVEQRRLNRLRTPVDLTLLMAIWILANQDTFRSTSRRFNCDRSVVHFNYVSTIEGLRELAHRFIKWPTRYERLKTARHYERITGFPGICGSIDCTAVTITAPEVQKQRYVDRHHAYSIKVQVVADHRRCIRDLYAGEPGSVHDARVFRRSPLSRNLFGREEMLDPDEHLLGDGAYALTDKILVPFPDNGNRNERERNFNRSLSSCRASVEHTFGVDKMKMRRILNRLFCKRMVYILDHIVASFVLCNFILLDGEDTDGVMYDGALPDVHVAHAIELSEAAGHAKREYIADLLLENNG